MAKEVKTRAFHFKINGYTPSTLPMARLAAYMADLAILLGSEDRVHFLKVGEGSADLVHEVEAYEEASVIERLYLVKNGLGPAEARKAYDNLNDKLRDDKTDALMVRGRGNLLKFPGILAPPPVTYGPIVQAGTLEGKLIKLGGKDDTKPIHIMDKDRVYICNANAEVAKKLAQAYDEFVRVQGLGRWTRKADGKWCLDHFNISTFELLAVDPLRDVVARLRELRGNGWREIEDPLSELATIRHGGKVN